MRYGVLGPLEVEADDGPVVVGGQKERLLLALLLTRPNRVVPVEALIRGLWGQHPPPTAAKTLQSHVMRLRRALEPGRARGAASEILVTREPGYLLQVPSGALDAARFEELTATARRTLADGAAQTAATMLRQALGLWRGQAFEEFLDSDFGAAEANRLAELRLVTLEDRIEADLRLGRHRELVAELEGLVHEQPLRERLWAQLLLALYRSGRQADALLAYQRARSVLVEDLGIDPGTELRRLQAAVLAQDPGLDLPPMAEPGPAQELPEALQQLGPTFVGRAAELAWLRAEWTRAADGWARVVFVTGRQGMGKTRLAAQFARQVHDQGGWVLYGRCVAAASDPLQPFTEALAGAGASVRNLPMPSAGQSGAAFGERLAQLLASRTAAVTLLIVDDLHLAEPPTLETLAALVAAAATRRLLVLGVYREEAATPGLAALVERLDPSGAGCRRLGPLDQHEVTQALALYQSEQTALAAAGAVLEATDGVPLLVHQAAADRAQAHVAHQIEETARQTANGRGQLRLVQARLADDVVDLRELREHTQQVARPVTRTGQGPLDEELEDRPAAVVCPYKGLARFEPSDAAFFFGRERLVAELVTHLVGTGLVGVVGPSGSGKSSLVRAGLLPALADGVLPGSDRWRQVLVRPGEHPLRELSLALGTDEGTTAATANGAAETTSDDQTRGPVPGQAAGNLVLEAAAAAGQRLLLVVDQFEEVFTTCRDEAERARFLATLTQAAQANEGRASIVLAVRADYYGHCAADPHLANLLAANHVLVGPMDPDELRRAIELPARRAGLRLEPGLAEAMIGEVAEEPGGLPLLSCALLESWQHRHGRTLTLAAYQQAGGVHGAVARLAERAWLALDPQDQAVARRILLRLAGPGEGEAVVRRRVPLDEVAPTDDQRRRAVLDALTDQRLLTKSHDSVEVAHEALLREWPRLRGWLEEDVQGRALHRHLIGAAQEWDRSGRDAGELYRGARLTGALDWACEHDGDLNQLEREFLDASRAAAERQVADARRRAEQEARRAHREARISRRLRGALAGLAVVLVLALVAGGLALSLRGRAEHQALVADSRRLGAQALLEDQLDRSLLLARQAVALDDSLETRSDLLAALLRSPAAAAVLPAHLNGIQTLGLSADGKLLATGEADGTVSIFDVRTRRLKEKFHGAITGVGNLEFSPDGKTLAINIPSLVDPVHLWDVQHARIRHNLSRRGTPEAGSVMNSVAFSTDGQTLFTLSASLDDAAAGPGYLTGWDVSSGHRLKGPVKVSSHGGVVLLATPDGKHLVVVDGTATLVLEARSFRLLRRFPHPLAQPQLVLADLSPRDGQTLALWPVDGPIDLLDLATGKRRRVWEPQQGNPGSIRFSPDGKWLAAGGGSGSNDKTVRLWDVASGQLRETFQGHEARVFGLRFSPDSHTLYSAAGKTVIAWDLEGSRRLGRPLSLFTPDRALRPPHSLAVSPDGTLVAAPDNKHWDHLVLMDLRSRARRLLAPGVGQIGAVAFSPDNKRLAVGGMVAPAPVLLDVASGKVLRRMTGGNRPRNFFTIQFDPNGRLLVTGAWPAQEAVVWDTATGRAILHLHHPTGEEFPFLLAAWSPDGSTVATTGGLGNIILWRATDGQQLATIKADTEALSAVAFSPDGSLLAVCGFGDWAVTLWNVATHRLVGRLPLPIYATTVAFDPHGKLLAASATDGKVYLFDVASRREIGTALPGDGLSVPAFDPTGKHLIVVYQFGPVLVWDIDPERWKQQACTVASRSLTREEWRELLPGRRYQPACR